jgi:hypothetical protein
MSGDGVLERLEFAIFHRFIFEACVRLRRYTQPVVAVHMRLLFSGARY